MGFMDQFSAPTTSSTGRIADNPKHHLLKKIEEEREKMHWVNASKNTVAPRPANRVWSSSTPDGKTNKVVKGEDVGVDFTDPAQYGKWLDSFRDAVQSGELDKEIDWWIANGKFQKS